MYIFFVFVFLVLCAVVGYIFKHKKNIVQPVAVAPDAPPAGFHPPVSEVMLTLIITAGNSLGGEPDKNVVTFIATLSQAMLVSISFRVDFMIDGISHVHYMTIPAHKVSQMDTTTLQVPVGWFDEGYTISDISPAEGDSWKIVLP